MSHGYLSVSDAYLDLCRKLEQSEVVGHGCPFLTDFIGHGILCQVAFVNEPLKTQRDFYRIQVFSLDVLNDGHFKHALIICLLYICRYGAQSGGGGGFKPTFPAYNLISETYFAYRYRLDYAELPDGLSEFGESILVKITPGLVRVGGYLLNGNLTYGSGIPDGIIPNSVFGWSRLGHAETVYAGYQGSEPFTQCVSFVCHTL